MLCPVPTPRRPGDPHARATGRAAAPPAACLLIIFTTAAPVTAAPEASSASSTAPAVTSPETTSATAVTSPAPANPAASTTSPATTNPVAPTTSPATTNPVATPTPAATAATATPPAAKSDAPPPAEIRTPASKPPRVDGPYIGAMFGGGGSFARVNNFETPDPMPGGSMALRFGQAIYPWMTIGLAISGTLARRFAEPSQRLLQGAVLVDLGFLPVPRIPLSLHVGFGAGGGAVRETGRSARSGFGGAVFTGAVRYEIFPLAARKRPRRGGGFSLGPELGWLGFTPAAKGRPMSNTIYVGLFMGFYFGS